MAGARAELIAAIVAAGVDAFADPGAHDPPYVYVRAEGVPDVSHVVRGTVEAEWTAVCVAGAWDHDGTAAMLDASKQAVLTALRGLAGWRLGTVGRDGIRSVADGALLLTADVSASRAIDI